jgi:nitrite reductase (NADH) large subunit
MSPALAKKQRRQWTWLHIMLFWPVPVLLGAHVVKSYYF